jgi:predicted  nucleic acid-binding Zn-ribbon protein
MSLTPISAGSLEALLAVQAIDTDLDRHHHRRATLPERAELVAIDVELATLEQRLSAARAARDSVAGEQSALETTLATVEARAKEVKKRLYGGSVSATRELQAMAAELDSLTARASELESRVLAVMGAWDPLDDDVTAIEGEKAARVAARAQAEVALEAGEADIDREIAILEAARTEAATHVPPDLAKTYEQLRRHLGGVGAARLVGARCGGCYLTLPATELDRLRHQGEGAISFCEQCGRILVPATRAR